MDLIYWSSLPGVPKKLKWPVKVTAFGQYTSVYCKSDDAQVKMEQLIPFPGEFEKLKQQGLVSLAKRPRNKIAFLDDVEWALKQVQNSRVIGLKDHELGWLCKHLGHTTDVHKLHYRAASGYIERINIGKLMLLQDFNVASKFKGQSLEDIRVEDILETAEKKDTGLGDEGEVEQEEAPDGQFLIDNSVSQSHRKNKKVVRQRWSLEEEEELNQLFEKNIRDRVCPSKQELHRAVSISREKSGKIHLRTLDNIKKKVWNMYKKFAE